MFTKIALFLFLFHSHHMFLVDSYSQRPGDLDVKLHTSVHNYQLQAGNLVEALTRVATDFNIPMGIEWVNTSSARVKINLSFKDATVEQVLNSIVSGQPSTKIVIKSGIIHVFMPGLVPDRENPLKLTINKFEVHDVPTEAASLQLHETVKRTLFSPKPQQGFRGGVAGSGASNLDDPKISVTLRNATVEDVLDALALASARKIWIVTFSDAPSLTSAGYRRTLGLWTNSPAPDDDQPVWDMLHWGDGTPSAALDTQ
jgi:hypothetical protein